jgi:hypothetical protein
MVHWWVLVHCGRKPGAYIIIIIIIISCAMASLILISSTMGRSISLALLLAGYKNTGLS